MEIVTALSDGYSIRSLSGESGLKIICEICKSPLMVTILSSPDLTDQDRITRLAVAIAGLGFNEAMEISKLALPQLSNKDGVCNSETFKNDSFKYFTLAAESIIKSTLFFSSSLASLSDS